MPLSGCRRIVTCHDAIPSRFPEHYMGLRDGGPYIGTRIARRRYRSADLVLAVSDSTRNDVVSIYGVSPERVERVYNGVDVERWAAPPTVRQDTVLERHGLRGRAFALYVGGLHWHKNVEGMMGGIARARARGIDIDLVWAGHLLHEQVAAVEGA